MSVQLYQGDCLKIMPTLPDHSIDAIICDLPYGQTAYAWDSVIPFEPLWAEYKRLIKPRGAIVLFGSQPFTSALVMSNPGWFRHEWIWEKDNGTNYCNAKYAPLKTHETISVFSPAKGRANQFTDECIVYNPQGVTPSKRIERQKTQVSAVNNLHGFAKQPDVYFRQHENFPKTVFFFPREGGLHPTQKPVALLKYLVSTYTTPGDVVMDNTMGSGTCGYAAVQLGRNFVGIELDPTYFAISQKRIGEAELQPSLFVVQPDKPEQLELEYATS